ncbi:MAG: PorT family protein [Bacteroidales bacterium]|nr:PorT family protein [Bacteroidales bacterium]MCF8390579.1 PorT family protein [Bacteroidales bacterium]
MIRIFFIVLILLPATLSAQVKKPQNLPGYDNKLIHFGFTVGASTQDYRFKRNFDDNIYANSTNPINSFGLQVTIISDLRLTDFATLRFLPGLALGQGTISFYEYDNYENFKKQDFELAALQFPLLLKLRSQRLNNYRPYFIGGLNYMYDMTGIKQSDSEVLVELKRGNLSLEFGYGIDLYLQYFKFAPEIKVGIGLMDLVDRDTTKGIPEYVNSLERISTYYVMLNFHFE